MGHFSTSNRLLGLACLIGAAAILVAWIPFDIDTGLFEKARRQLRIGDALLPTVACAFVLLGGLMVILQPKGQDEFRIPKSEALRILGVLVLLAIAFALMRWAGGFSVFLFADGGDYRPLRDTVPWKHIGFISGGSVLVAGLIAMAEKRISVRAIVIGLAVTLVLIAVYDLPFDDLLLPPNGDV